MEFTKILQHRDTWLFTYLPTLYNKVPYVNIDGIHQHNKLATTTYQTEKKRKRKLNCLIKLHTLNNYWDRKHYVYCFTELNLSDSSVRTGHVVMQHCDVKIKLLTGIYYDLKDNGKSSFLHRVYYEVSIM